MGRPSKTRLLTSKKRISPSSPDASKASKTVQDLFCKLLLFWGVRDGPGPSELDGPKIATKTDPLDWLESFCSKGPLDLMYIVET